jgi:hypothetical protein
MGRKSIRVIPKKSKKRGRPATGKDPLVAFRLPREMIRDLDRWAAQNEANSRSGAIRAVMERGMYGFIYNSKGIGVAKVEGSAIFNNRGKQIYELRGTAIYHLSGEPTGQHLQIVGASQLSEDGDKLFEDT